MGAKPHGCLPPLAIQLRDDPAAQADIALIEHGVLPGGYRPLGLPGFDDHLAALLHEYAHLLVWLAVAVAAGAGKLALLRRADEVERLCLAAAGIKSRAVCALLDV